MNRDGFLFYRSYYEAIKNLPDNIKLEVYNAVMEYGLYGNEIELHDEFARSIFTLIKPVLETNNKKFKSGKSGGRPRKEKPMVLKNENQSKTYGFENSGKNENLRHLMIKDISSDEDIGYRIEDKDISSDEDDIYLECIKIHSCPPCPADASGSNPEDSDLPTADAEIAPNDREEIPSPPGSAPPPSPIEKRERTFRDSLAPFVSKYGEEMIRAFCDYWTERNKSGTKMRFEMEKTWDTARRLVRWDINNNKFKRDYAGNTKPVYGNKAPEEFGKGYWSDDI